MERIQKLHELLQELIGLHSDLLEQVKKEAVALAEADLKVLNETALAKEALIHWIRRTENFRQAVSLDVARELDLQGVSPSLRQIILASQQKHPVQSEALQTDLNVLMHLVQRVRDQNIQNEKIIEQGLRHIMKMRENIMDEVQPVKTYNPQGTKNVSNAGQSPPRMISKEA